MSTYIYVIDKFDKIISVSDNWLSFAQQNMAGVSCHPDNILNISLWKFIKGIETKQLYKILLKTVRTKGRSIGFPFRCDSPAKRRYLELTISPIHQEYIEFSSRIIREELRDTVKILEWDIPRSDELIKMCSMCKKVELGTIWVEVEAAIASLKLFEQNRLPRISHGLCPGCYERAIAQI